MAKNSAFDSVNVAGVDPFGHVFCNIGKLADNHETTELIKSRQVCDRDACFVILFSVTFGKDEIADKYEIADMGGKASHAKSTVDLRFGGR